MHFFPRYLLLFLSLLAPVLGLQAQHYRIGVVGSDGPRARSFLQQLKAEADLHPEVRLLLRASADPRKQAQFLGQLLDGKQVDALVLADAEPMAVTPLLRRAMVAGMPVVVLQEQEPAHAYQALVGPDNREVGFRAGEYLRKRFGQGRPMRILEVVGTPGETATQGRSLGLREGLGEEGPLAVTWRLEADWDREQARRKMDSLLTAGVRPDIIFAQSDAMAQGVAESLKPLEGYYNPFLIGAGGLPGAEGGLQALMDGRVDASVFYPTGASEAFAQVLQLLKGERGQVRQWLPVQVVEPQNARVIQLQHQQLQDYQQKIERQRAILDEQVLAYQSQRTRLLMGGVGLVALLLLSAALWYLQATRKRLNAALTESNALLRARGEEVEGMAAQLRTLTEARLHFFTNISHELRTPLTLLLSPLEQLLEELPADHPQRGRLQLMQQQVYRLSRLVNELLDFRKLEEGKMPLRLQQADLGAQLRELQQAFAPLAAQREVGLRFERQLPRKVYAYAPEALDKILFNLLSNALKFTPAGGEVCCSAAEEPNGWVLLQVRDNGVGMDARTLARIFERFYQGEGSRSEGTGIGMSLVQELVALHGGRVSVESAPGQGTTVQVWLPMDGPVADGEAEAYHSSLPILSEWAEPSAQEQPPMEDGRPRLLLVEDDPGLRQYLAQALADGYEVRTARDGQEGWELAQEWLPDLLVSDVMMPRMDGFALCGHVKSDERTGHIPVLLLTAKDAEEHRMQGYGQGADAYVGKPFRLAYLRLRLGQLLGAQRRLQQYYAGQLGLAPMPEALPQDTAGASAQAEVAAEVSETAAPELQHSAGDLRFLGRLQHLMEQHYADSEFSVERLGELTGLSRTQLYRKLKGLTGLTPTDFIRQYRLQQAVELLRQGGKQVSEVAYATGFSSQAYFSRVFKEVYGVAPSEFV